MQAQDTAAGSQLIKAGGRSFKQDQVEAAIQGAADGVIKPAQEVSCFDSDFIHLQSSAYFMLFCPQQMQLTTAFQSVRILI